MAAGSWLGIPAESHFPVQNLPFGIFSTRAAPKPRVGVAVGDLVLDLQRLSQAGLFSGPLLSQSDCFQQVLSSQLLQKDWNPCLVLNLGTSPHPAVHVHSCKGHTASNIEQYRVLFEQRACFSPYKNWQCQLTSHLQAWQPCVCRGCHAPRLHITHGLRPLICITSKVGTFWRCRLCAAYLKPNGLGCLLCHCTAGQEAKAGMQCH